MKSIYTIARLLVLLSGVTGLVNLAPVHVNSFSVYGDKAPALRPDLAMVRESYSKIPLSFVPNFGQADDKNVKFISRGNGYSLALAPTIHRG